MFVKGLGNLAYLFLRKLLHQCLGGLLVLIIIFSPYQAAQRGSSGVIAVSFALVRCSSAVVLYVLGSRVFSPFPLWWGAYPFYDRLRPVPDHNLNCDVYLGRGMVDDENVFPEKASTSPVPRPQPFDVASELAFQEPC